MTTSTPSAPTPLQRQLAAFRRTVVIAVAVAAIALGIVVLVWPHGTFATVGFLFAIFLVVAGVQRIVTAIAARREIPRIALALGVVAGLLILGCGVVALAAGLGTTALAIVIGIGWLLGGVLDVVLAFRARRAAQGIAWLRVLGGVVTALAGVAFVVAPIVSAKVALVLGGILLIVVGIALLLTVVRRGEAS